MRRRKIYASRKLLRSVVDMLRKSGINAKNIRKGSGSTSNKYVLNGEFDSKDQEALRHLGFIVVSSRLAYIDMESASWLDLVRWIQLQQRRVGSMKASIKVLYAQAARELRRALADDAKQIADTIARQLGGYGRLKAMLGAKDFLYDRHPPSFQFKFPNKEAGRPNFVKIIYNSGKDLYDVEFGRIRGSRYKVTRKFDNVYASTLKKLFEKETGLYLSL